MKKTKVLYTYILIKLFIGLITFNIYNQQFCEAINNCRTRIKFSAYITKKTAQEISSHKKFGYVITHLYDSYLTVNETSEPATPELEKESVLSQGEVTFSIINTIEYKDIVLSCGQFKNRLCLVDEFLNIFPQFQKLVNNINLLDENNNVLSTVSSCFAFMFNDKVLKTPEERVVIFCKINSYELFQEKMILEGMILRSHIIEAQERNLSEGEQPKESIPCMAFDNQGSNYKAICNLVNKRINIIPDDETTISRNQNRVSIQSKTYSLYNLDNSTDLCFFKSDVLNALKTEENLLKKSSGMLKQKEYNARLKSINKKQLFIKKILEEANNNLREFNELSCIICHGHAESLSICDRENGVISKGNSEETSNFKNKVINHVESFIHKAQLAHSISEIYQHNEVEEYFCLTNGNWKLLRNLFKDYLSALKKYENIINKSEKSYANNNNSDVCLKLTEIVKTIFKKMITGNSNIASIFSNNIDKCIYNMILNKYKNCEFEGPKGYFANTYNDNSPLDQEDANNDDTNTNNNIKSNRTKDTRNYNGANNNLRSKDPNLTFGNAITGNNEYNNNQNKYSNNINSNNLNNNYSYNNQYNNNMY